MSIKRVFVCDLCESEIDNDYIQITKEWDEYHYIIHTKIIWNELPRDDYHNKALHICLDCLKELNKDYQAIIEGKKND